MSYEHYRNLMPLPYPNEPICGGMPQRPQMPAGVLTSSLPSGESDPAVMQSCAPAGPSSHALELDILEALIAANNASCEDDVPLFLRRARA